MNADLERGSARGRGDYLHFDETEGNGEIPSDKRLIGVFPAWPAVGVEISPAPVFTSYTWDTML